MQQEEPSKINEPFGDDDIMVVNTKSVRSVSVLNNLETIQLDDFDVNIPQGQSREGLSAPFTRSMAKMSAKGKKMGKSVVDKGQGDSNATSKNIVDWTLSEVNEVQHTGKVFFFHVTC